jgi:hypothetical protein
MNEATINHALPSGRQRLAGTSSSRKSSAFYGYSITIIALGIGWLLRDFEFISPKQGAGYWLGIIGGSLMLALLLYPLRKRIRLLRFLGGTSAWFRAHMVLGVIGPVLVLYHSNFQLGSFNSQIALFCMLAVAGSGVVGRHIYAEIHRGLYGEKTSMSELRDDLTMSLKQSHGLASLMPKLTAELESLSGEVQGDQITGSLSTGLSLRWMVRQYTAWWSLHRTAKRELRAGAAESPAIAKDYDRLKKTSSKYIRRFVRLTGRIAKFTLYERLFSLWHVLHLPLFFMMVISALIHVLAVHMY